MQFILSLAIVCLAVGYFIRKRPGEDPISVESEYRNPGLLDSFLVNSYLILAIVLTWYPQLAAGGLSFSLLGLPSLAEEIRYALAGAAFFVALLTALPLPKNNLIEPEQDSVGKTPAKFSFIGIFLDFIENFFLFFGKRVLTIRLEIIEKHWPLFKNLLSFFIVVTAFYAIVGFIAYDAEHLAEKTVLPLPSATPSGSPRTPAPAHPGVNEHDSHADEYHEQGSFPQNIIGSALPRTRLLTTIGEFWSRIMFPLLGGILAAVALFFTYKRTTAIMKQATNMEEQLHVTQAQLRITEKTLDNSRKQIVVEQFKNAITQLGSDKRAVVLGGVHTLYSIARNLDSREEYAHTVFELLCSFIREETARPEYKWPFLSDEERANPVLNTTTLEPHAQAASLIVIQTIIDKLFREGNTEKIYHDKTAELAEVFLRKSNLNRAYLRTAILSNADLQAAVLRHANLEQANLKRANFRDAELQHANLQKTFMFAADFEKADLQNANMHEVHAHEAIFRFADLRKASLQDADLRRSCFDNANLQFADLQFANFQNASLNSADLQESNLEDADFRNAEMQKAILRKTELHKAHFGETNLREAELRQAKMQEADLEGANLQEADLREADLRGAHMQNADLRKAKLQSANLREADLRRANLQGTNLQAAIIKRTIFGVRTILREAHLDGVQSSQENYWKLVETAFFEEQPLKADLTTVRIFDGQNELVMNNEQKIEWFRNKGAIISDISAEDVQRIFRHRFERGKKAKHAEDST